MLEAYYSKKAKREGSYLSDYGTLNRQALNKLHSDFNQSELIMNFAIHSQRNANGQKRPRLMQIGDLVIVYESHSSLDHFYLQPGKLLDNKFGQFSHSDMIGKPFGSKIVSKSSNSGWLYLLEPTPELWGIAVHSRTQIVNEIDGSMIIMMLNIHPGCIVVETGTGSGCMTINLARTIFPTGHVYTYEYNEVRAETAREEFKKLKIDPYITVTHHNVCAPAPADYSSSSSASSSYAFPGRSATSADAVFLDLPEPWLAIEQAKFILKPGKTLCCYSPCIDQVMKSCEKLRAMGFHSIRMLEVRQRPFDARVVPLETLDLGIEVEDEDDDDEAGEDEGAEDEEESESYLSFSAQEKNDQSLRDPINYHMHYNQDQPSSFSVSSSTGGSRPATASTVADSSPNEQQGEGAGAAAVPATSSSSSGKPHRPRGRRDRLKKLKQKFLQQQEHMVKQAFHHLGSCTGNKVRHQPKKVYKQASTADQAEDELEEAANEDEEEEAVTDEGPDNKKQKTTEVATTATSTTAAYTMYPKRIENRPRTNTSGFYHQHVARPLASMKGHTAFLTFAIKPLDT